MAFHLWEQHPFPDAASRKQFLEWIVAVEVVAIIALALTGPVLRGEVWWLVGVKLAGVLLAAVLAALFAARAAPWLVGWLERGLHLQVHFLVLVIFALAAIGERLGLSAPKTAFVLGMFISRSTHEEAGLNRRLEPVRDRLFVPVFFFGLGTLVEPQMFLTAVFMLAVAAGAGLFLLRRWVFQRRLAAAFGTDAGAHVITAPVLTIAAVAVEILARGNGSQEAITWTLAVGLCMTLIAAVFPVAELSGLATAETAMAAPQAWDQVSPDRTRTQASPP